MVNLYNIWTKIIKTSLFLVILMVAVNCQAVPVDIPVTNTPSHNRVDILSIAHVRKLSGLVFHPQRKTLFAVSDSGYIIELTTDGDLIQENRVDSKYDFEGITYSPVTGLLYAAVEDEQAILEINPQTFEAIREIPIGVVFDGNVLLTPKGKGIEGITFVPAQDDLSRGTFYLANQSDKLEGPDASIIFEVDVIDVAGRAEARIIQYFSIGITDLSGLDYLPKNHTLLVISDSNNVLLEVSLTGQVLQIYPLSGSKQEGIAIDDLGFLYIAQDAKKETQILKFGLPNNPGPNQ